MTTWQLLTSTWHLHPSIMLGCAGLLLAYAAATRFQVCGKALWYVGGVLVLLAALQGPLHELGDNYLFSAHMLQHLLLTLVVPPLLLLGLPADATARLLRPPAVNRAARALGQPLAAWLLGMGMLWVWHLPALYNAALEDQTIHIVEHLCFLVTAVIFWWPIMAPLEQARLTPPTAMAYLFAAMIASSILGILLTFAAPGLYPAYLQPHDSLRLLSLLRDQWGLTPAADQQLGGLLMWVPGNLAYLWAFIVVLARWYGAPDEAATDATAASAALDPALVPYQGGNADGS